MPPAAPGRQLTGTDSEAQPLSDGPALARPGPAAAYLSYNKRSDGSNTPNSAFLISVKFQSIEVR